MSRARTLRRRRADVGAFAEALDELVPLLDVDPRTPGGSRQRHPREGREVEAVQLAAKFDFAAGPAALAFNDSGVFVSWKPPGTFQQQPVNPAQGWRTTFDQYAMFGPDVILQCCAQAFGILETRSVDAEEEEATRRRLAMSGRGKPAGPTAP